ncbi:hypothetical protein A0J61_07148 [Choanephora cucurbitarum]|uniref:START domain-containing protein n=1 Tax=Choanephora cucurbitarum TaxID=101091 RepID=A0A1C7N6W1_9FUNG|nr:hypothetical protein A0J61_07148 [Choanephora cucurbitarum]
MSAKKANQENINWVERVTQKRCQVRYVSTIADHSQSYYFGLQVDLNQHTVVSYLRWDSVVLNASDVSHMLLSFFNHLTNPPISAWISQCDESIVIQHQSYQEESYTIDYIYQLNQTKLSTNALEIHRKINQHHRWHSGSWDQQTLRRTNFLSSSLLLNSASSSPQIHPVARSSYPDNRQMFPWATNDDDDDEVYLSQLDSDELCIQMIDKPDVSLLVIDKPTWSEKFSQQCVQLYDQGSKGYMLQIIHPRLWMQQLKENLEEIMKLDDEDSTSIHIQLTLQKSKNSVCTVNGIEWPIKSRTLSSSDEEDNDTGQSDQEDIFVDGMEEIASPKLTEIPKMRHLLIKPSSSAPVPTLQTTNDNDDLDVCQKKPASIHEPVDSTLSHTTIDSFVPDIHLSKQDTISPREHAGTSTYLNSTQGIDQLAESEPIALQKIYPQFIDYLQPSSASIIQAPSKENGYVTIKSFPIPNHPMGGFLSESRWKNCSLWDIKAVIETAGARRVWDTTFENAVFLHSLTTTSALWHTKLKGAWPVQPRDYVCFHGQYAFPNHIDLLSTSCFGDTFQYKPLPQKNVPGYTRATMDLAGCRIERIDQTSVLVRQVVVTQFPSWVIQYLTSRALVQTCSAIQFARDYLETHGAPPSLMGLECASLGDVKYDHERKSWRCEYTRSASKDESTSTITSVIIRLDKKKWTTNHYSVVIDPPPSNTSAVEKSHDPTGVWLSVEHDEAYIIPFRGKILVLIKLETSAVAETKENGLQVNGVMTPIQKKEEECVHLYQEPLKKSHQELDPSMKLNEAVDRGLDDAAIKQHAQTALSFLKQAEEEFGWNIISDNHRSGIRISKRSSIKDNRSSKGLTDTHQTPLFQVVEPYMVYKGSKVMENFSVDEILAVIKDTGHVRASHDDTIESPTEVVHQTDAPACKIIRHAVKAVFPFKSRDVYAVSCLATECTSVQRALYVESALPDSPAIQSKKPMVSFYLSGWILEEVDPYSTKTNHPIPSTRVTHVGSLDLGSSIPSYISNLVANNWFPRKLNAVEAFLKLKGPPPFLTQPNFALDFTNNVIMAQASNVEWSQVYWCYNEQHHVEFKAHLRLVEHEGILRKRQGKEVDSKPSKHATSISDISHRRGSLPSTILPKSRLNLTTSASTSTVTKNIPVSSVEKTVTITTRGHILLQMTMDLRAFENGYEIETQLFDLTDKMNRSNATHKLRLSISEPSLAQLMDGKKQVSKHTIVIQTKQGKPLSSSLPALFEFYFKLIPIEKEKLSERAKKLTVSHVLKADIGADKNEWDGLILVNGQEIQPQNEVELRALKDEEAPLAETQSISVSDPTSPSKHTTSDRESDVSVLDVKQLDLPSGTVNKSQSESDKISQFAKSGGVVATALGNVSASVNTIGAHMMSPFKTASGSFLSSSSTDLNNKAQPDSEQTLGEKEHPFKKQVSTENDHAKTHSYCRQLSSMVNGCVPKWILLFIASLIILVMLTLLLLYFASLKLEWIFFNNLDYTTEQQMLCQLLHTTWFGEWDIQIVATRRAT